jgi:hypothetical protein
VYRKYKTISWFDFRKLIELFENGIDSVVKLGYDSINKTIIDIKSKIDTKNVQFSTYKFVGDTFNVIFILRDENNSSFIELMCKHAYKEFMDLDFICFITNRDKGSNVTHVSMRNNLSNINLGEIARKYGGGGNRRSASFTLSGHYNCETIVDALS